MRRMKLTVEFPLPEDIVVKGNIGKMIAEFTFGIGAELAKEFECPEVDLDQEIVEVERDDRSQN